MSEKGLKKITKTFMGFTCKRPTCGYEWEPHNPDKPPVTCPKCKSPYWNREPREKK